MEKNFALSDIEKTLSNSELRLYKMLKNFGAHNLEEIVTKFGFLNKETADVLIRRLKIKLNKLDKEEVQRIKIGKDKYSSYYITEKNKPLI